MKPILIAAAALLVPVIASAADPAPDMKGRWVGKTYSIVAGKGGHWPSSTGTLNKPGLFEKDLTLEIRGQEGRRFWGATIISGGNERTEEPFIGELFGKDNKKVMVADTDGFIWGDIDGDTFSFCYAHAGAPSTVVSCTEVTRAR
jgi:hypothetical protein